MKTYIQGNKWSEPATSLMACLHTHVYIQGNSWSEPATLLMACLHTHVYIQGNSWSEPATSHVATYLELLEGKVLAILR